jgi:hypothetical protein
MQPLVRPLAPARIRGDLASYSRCMAITVSAADFSPAHPQYPAVSFGSMRGRIGSITLPASSTYATGGFSLGPAVFGMSQVFTAIVRFRPTGAGAGRLAAYNPATGVVLAYEDGATVAGAFDEVPNATDLTGAVLDVVVFGA